MRAEFVKWASATNSEGSRLQLIATQSCEKICTFLHWVMINGLQQLSDQCFSVVILRLRVWAQVVSGWALGISHLSDLCTGVRLQWRPLQSKGKQDIHTKLVGLLTKMLHSYVTARKLQHSTNIPVNDNDPILSPVSPNLISQVAKPCLSCPTFLIPVTFGN